MTLAVLWNTGLGPFCIADTRTTVDGQLVPASNDSQKISTIRVSCRSYDHAPSFTQEYGFVATGHFFTALAAVQLLRRDLGNLVYERLPLVNPPTFEQLTDHVAKVCSYAMNDRKKDFDAAFWGYDSYTSSFKVAHLTHQYLQHGGYRMEISLAPKPDIGDIWLMIGDPLAKDSFTHLNKTLKNPRAALEKIVDDKHISSVGGTITLAVPDRPGDDPCDIKIVEFDEPRNRIGRFSILPVPAWAWTTDHSVLTLDGVEPIIEVQP